jgi:hypothetical protein
VSKLKLVLAWILYHAGDRLYWCMSNVFGGRGYWLYSRLMFLSVHFDRNGVIWHKVKDSDD